FNDTATTEIYTLSLHDALPIYIGIIDPHAVKHGAHGPHHPWRPGQVVDRRRHARHILGKHLMIDPPVSPCQARCDRPISVMVTTNVYLRLCRFNASSSCKNGASS